MPPTHAGRGTSIGRATTTTAIPCAEMPTRVGESDSPDWKGGTRAPTARLPADRLNTARPRSPEHRMRVNTKTEGRSILPHTLCCTGLPCPFGHTIIVCLLPSFDTARSRLSSESRIRPRFPKCPKYKSAHIQNAKTSQSRDLDEKVPSRE